MSGMRQKDQADFDLETFVDLFDTALTSDNPTVRRAFKNLILVASIVQAEENGDTLANGPLRRLVEDVRNLNRRISNMEAQGAYRATPNTGGYNYTGTGTVPPVQPTWVATGTGQTAQPNPPWPYSGGGGGPTAWASATNTASTTKNSTSATSSLLKKLEEKDES